MKAEAEARTALVGWLYLGSRRAISLLDPHTVVTSSGPSGYGFDVELWRDLSCGADVVVYPGYSRSLLDSHLVYDPLHAKGEA